MEQLAVDQARILGPDHPDTVQSRHMRAFYLDIAGESPEAARLMAGVVADRARVLGADHSATRYSRRMLASYACLGPAPRARRTVTPVIVRAAHHHRPGRRGSRAAGLGRYTPVVPSMRSRTRSAWPLWRAYSSIMWT
ncbi:tetratricopeptide repeat protein [Streptomyces atratus]|uniref:tetratricopeptide repeat protein n=1 Tax=Streptomyces atratus TaxID=1893 RepID=UPI002F912396